MKVLFFLTLIACIALALLTTPCECMKLFNKFLPKKIPMCLIPGIGGSPLYSYNTKTHKYCLGNPQMYGTTTWLSKLRTFFATSCLRNELKLNFDIETSQFIENKKNIKTIVPFFGKTTGIEYIDSQSFFPLAKYYKPAVDYFVGRGYKRNKNLVAAPYDWRYAPDMLDETGYYDKLKSLIEQTYEGNDNTRVALVVHSMGAQVSLYFLTDYKHVDQKWKDKYIEHYIPIAPAFDGGVAALPAVISGYHKTPKIPYLHTVWDDFVVDVSRTLESVNSLVPRFSGRTMIKTPNKKYDATNLGELYADIDYQYGKDYNKMIEKIDSRMHYPPPNVNTILYQGIGVETPEGFIYDEDFGKGVNTVSLNPEVIYGDGDGTVNRHSAEIVVNKWSGLDSMDFELRSLQNADHMSILRDKRLLDDIFSHLNKNSKTTLLEQLRNVLLMQLKIERLEKQLNLASA